MGLTKIIGVVLIAAGVAGLIYGKVQYTKETHEGSVAGIEFSLKEKNSVQIPKWAGAGAIGVGTLLLLFGRKK
ncbi:MAG: hypothetical protein H6R27_2093 [Proteobacteria bacterium]|nr:hypothetical protein [Pseudomonadota bacterium]